MINKWLDEFKSAWTAKDIDRVLDLFTDDIEYWETPHVQLKDKGLLRQEWGAVLEQRQIDLNVEVFSSSDSKHSVLWKLSYVNVDSVQQDWAGTYLIELDNSGKCTYFHQTGEKR